MNRWTIAALFLSLPLLADDAAVAEKLKASGVDITLVDGKASKLVVKDGSKLTEADYKTIGTLTTLKSLNIGAPSTLNDTNLAHLRGLQNVEDFQTDRMDLTDEGYKHFAEMKGLKRLALYHPSYRKEGFTGVGVAYLKALPKLERLIFAGGTTGDELFTAAATLTQLKSFSTWHTYNSPESTAIVGKMTHLQTLKLGQRLRRYDGKPNPHSLTDAVLPNLANLKEIEWLELDEARLTYAGLASLKSLPKLKRLTLFRIDIPAEDVEKLRKELPNVKIEWMAMTEMERKGLDSILTLPKQK